MLLSLTPPTPPSDGVKPCSTLSARVSRTLPSFYPRQLALSPASPAPVPQPMPPKIKRVGKYELGATLGVGSHGRVKLCRDITTNSTYAIKMMDKERIRQAHMGSQIKKEVRSIPQAKVVVTLLLALCCSQSLCALLSLLSATDSRHEAPEPPDMHPSH